MAVGGVSSTRPRSGAISPAQHLEQRRLADAVRSDEPDPVAVGHGEVDGVEHDEGTPRHLQAAGAEGGGGGHATSLAAKTPGSPRGSSGRIGACRSPVSTTRRSRSTASASSSSQEDDVDVIQARIADRLQVSRPAVSEMMRRLETEGLITTDAGIHLTDAGRALAERVVRRHRLAERFLTDVLQLSWAEAHHEAGALGARDEPRRRAGDGPPPRQPDHVPARQPDPGIRLRRALGRAARHRRRRVELHGAPHPRGARVHARAARVPRAVASWCRAPRAPSPRCRPTAR